MEEYNIFVHFKDSRITSETARVTSSQRGDGFHLVGDDEMVNDEELAEEMNFAKLCASGDCSSMPSKQKMQIKVNCKRLIKECFYKVSFYCLLFSLDSL
jgi:hypothetical protein